MRGWWPCLVAGALVLAASPWLGLRADRRVGPALVRLSRGSPRRAVLVGLGLQLAGLLGFAVAGVVAVAVDDLAGRAAGRVAGTIAVLAYAPVAFQAVPGEVSGYRPQRCLVEAQGASKAVSRALTWPSGPVALVGLAAVVGAHLAMWAQR